MLNNMDPTIPDITGQADPNAPITSGISENATDEIKFKKLSGIKKLKEFFSRRMNPLQDRWNKLPKKYRVFLSLFGILIFILLIISAAFLIKSGKLNEITDFGVGVEEFGDWKRLEIPQRQPPFFTLSSETVSKYGILPNETLILKTEKPVDAGFIRENIVASVPVQVSSISKQEFKIRPAGVLGLSEIFKINIAVEDKEYEGNSFDRNYSWAYQTQGKFRVLSSIPGDKKTEVPVNTGIEFAFSQDDYNDPTSFINISPSIRFRTEMHAERFAVVPLDPLEEKTVYTVTLKKGLNLKSRNDPISEDYSFSFQTAYTPNTKPVPQFYMYENFQQIADSEQFIAKVNTYNWSPDNTIKADVYRFPSAQSFIDSRKKIDEIQSSWMEYYAEDEAVNTSGLDKVMTFELKVQSKDNINYIQLPDKLPKGFYVLHFWFGNKEKLEQLWLQSTDITGFVSVGKEQTVVWSNYVEGEPVKNAQITIPGSTITAQTYDNGTSVINTPQAFFESKRHYVQISNQAGSTVFLPVNNLSGSTPPGKITGSDYWSYLYNERHLYKPGDTVYFFGVIKNRSNNSAPSSIDIYLRNSDYNQSGNVLSKKIAPNSDGSFIDSFKLENVAYGWYNLVLSVNGVDVETSSFSVTQYEKPEMKIEVSSDKKAVFTDEKVNYGAKVTFFDGTPAKNIPVAAHESMTGKSTEFTTGENGEVSYTYETKYTSAYNYPRYETVTFIPTIAQEANIEGFGSAFVFGSRLMIRSDSDQDGNKAKIKANVNNVDLSRINAGTSNDYKGTPAQNVEVLLKVTKIWYETKEAGTYYDFIEKVTRKTYNYIRHEDPFEDKKLKTDSNGEIRHEFTMEEGKSYSATMEVKDSQGHPEYASEYYYYNSASYDYGGGYENPQLNIDKEENSFSLNDDVNVNIKLGDKEYPDNNKNRFLFIIAGRGRQEIVQTNEPKFSFKFLEKHIPNVYLGGYVYTGKYYLKATAPCKRDWSCSDYYYYDYGENYFSGLLLTYKKEDSELTVSLKPDKEKYQPGDEAKISVKVEKDGTPAAISNVNLVLVDEALAAIGGVRSPSILSTLYQSVDSFIYYNYSSHQPVLQDKSMAERGGGGGGDRDVFKDAAFFGRQTTDSNGVAEFKFTLPDNITSWVVYAQAVTQQIDAGQTEGKVIVTKDFFVTSQFPSEFLVKDKPAISGGSFGKALSSDNNVVYQALFFKDNKEIQKQEKSAKAFKTINFPFPTLEPGNYQASLRGKVGDNEDGINLPFSVVSSRLNFEYYEKYDLSSGQSLNEIKSKDFIKDKPIQLIISDKGRGMFYSALKRYCSVYSNRLEKQVARLSSSEILKSRFEDKGCENEDINLSEFQNFDGGLSQVSWGGSDLPTSAWTLHVDSSSFDKEKLISYFNSKLIQSDGGSLQKIYAVWGLIMLGEPKLNELQVLSNAATTYEEKVTAAFALIAAGENEKARELYYDVLADYAYEYKPYIRIQAELKGKSQTDSFIENTSRALLLGNMIERSYDEEMYNYVRDFRTQAEDVVIDLSTIVFIDELLSKLPDEDTTISFTSSAQNIQKSLNKGRNISLSLNSNELDSFTLKVLEGKAEAFFNYYVGTDGFNKLPNDPLLSIKRSYKKAKGEGSDIKTGDLVEIRIDYNINLDKSPTGCYTITDHLPSGLKYISNPGAYGLNDEGWLSEKTNNIIEGNFCNSEWWRLHGKRYMIYFARAGSVGEFVSEPAIIQSQRYLSNFQKTQEEIIKIEASNQ